MLEIAVYVTFAISCLISTIAVFREWFMEEKRSSNEPLLWVAVVFIQIAWLLRNTLEGK
jgi:hypothetical protein